MIDKQRVSAKACEVTPPNLVAQYFDISELEATIRSMGRSMVLRQLQAGPLQCAENLQRCAGISIMHESASRQIEFETVTRAGHVTFITPAYSSSMWINGHTATSETVFCLPPGTELHGLSPENADLLTIHVPISLLRAAGLDTRNAWAGLIAGGVACTEPDVAYNARLRRLLHFPAQAPLPLIEQETRAAELLDCLDLVVGGHVGEGDSFSISSRESYRVINTAKQYIDANLHDDISMGDVCRAAATSLSKLERIFRHELQLSPAGYIHARRLDAVRKVLTQSTPCSTSVMAVALDHGLNHLGRFSGAYRRQFGELPSETLRAT